MVMKDAPDQRFFIGGLEVLEKEPTLVKNDEVTVRCTLQSYLDYMVLPDPYNRGGKIYVRRVVDMLKRDFDFKQLNNCRLSQITNGDGEKILMHHDWHNRRQALLELFEEGKLTPYLHCMLTIVVVAGVDHVDSLDKQSRPSLHRTSDKAFNPSMVAGQRVVQFVNLMEEVEDFPEIFRKSGAINLVVNFIVAFHCWNKKVNGAWPLTEFDYPYVGKMKNKYKEVRNSPITSFQFDVKDSDLLKLKEGFQRYMEYRKGLELMIRDKGTLQTLGNVGWIGTIICESFRDEKLLPVRMKTLINRTDRHVGYIRDRIRGLSGHGGVVGRMLLAEIYHKMRK